MSHGKSRNRYRKRAGRSAARKYKRKRFTRTNTAIFRGPNGIPDRLISKYPYAQTFSIATTTTVGTQFFRNSMYDPDFTGTGHQPFMRDQIAALYKKYRCYGFKYDIMIQNTSSSDSMRYCVLPINHTGTNNMDSLWEKPYGKYGLLTPDTGSKNIVRIRGFLSANKILGVTKKQFSAEKAFSGDTGNNPTTEAYLGIFTIASNEVTSVSARITVKLTMYTMYFDRAIITHS